MVRADYSNWVNKLKPMQHFRHAGKLGLKGPLSPSPLFPNESTSSQRGVQGTPLHRENAHSFRELWRPND